MGHTEGAQQWSLSKSFISDTIQRFFDTQGQKKSKCAVMKYLVRRNLQTEGRRTKNWEMIGCVCHLIYYQPSLRESSSPLIPKDYVYNDDHDDLVKSALSNNQLLWPGTNGTLLATIT